MYIHTKVVYKIHEFSSYALKNRIYFELRVKHKGDNAPFHKVLNAPLSIHRDAGKLHTGHMLRVQNINHKKCSVIEKYLKFPLCSFFLYCPLLHSKNILST